MSGAALGVVLVLLALDVQVAVFGAVTPDRDNAAYAALRGDGRLLELPVFRPDIHFGSVYLAYARQSPRERPQGYSTTAPPAADRLARDPALALLRPRAGAGRSSAIRYVVVHRGLYGQSGFFAPGCADRAEQALRRDGWRLLARDGPISSWER